MKRSFTCIFTFSRSLMLLNVFAFGGCHSSDMGDQAPDRVPMDTTLADWDHGAGKIIQQKCANCHTAQRGQSVPGNTPHMLDGIANPSFFTEKKNRVLIKMMKDRIEDQSSEKMMPPRFATPLYDDERAGVLACLTQFLNNFDGQGQPTPTPTPTPTPDPQSPPKPKLTFADVKPIVMGSCATSNCHVGGDYISLQTREEIAAEMPKLLRKILDGDMPMDYDGDFTATADGKKLIEWLSGDMKE